MEKITYFLIAPLVNVSNFINQILIYTLYTRTVFIRATETVLNQAQVTRTEASGTGPFRDGGIGDSAGGGDRKIRRDGREKTGGKP